jgi:CheY-like chemotaxis protein
VDNADAVLGPPVRFVGDLDDPWVASIADALPAGTTRVNCPGDLAGKLLEATTGILVLHRRVLTGSDAEWLARWRSERNPPDKVILCFGPHARYADLERWAALIDAAVPEATALDTIARHLTLANPAGRIGPIRSSASPRRRVAIVSTNVALRKTLAEACDNAGYSASGARDWSEAHAHAHGLAVWDVPVLDGDWPQALARRARVGPVVALIGFADRVLVTEARASGASACLELPVDLADLLAVLDRLPTPRNEHAHEVPPPPAAKRRSASASARVVADAGRDA